LPREIRLSLQVASTGRVIEVAENVVTIEIANDVKVRVDKNAVLRDPSDMEKK